MDMSQYTAGAKDTLPLTPPLYVGIRPPPYFGGGECQKKVLGCTINACRLTIRDKNQV